MGTWASGRADLAADRVALEVPGHVLADVAQALELVLEVLDEQFGVAVHGLGDLGQARAVKRVSVPSKAACRSPKSQGRPWQPRPTTTPSTPVCSTMATASSALQMSPLPSTGMSGRASRSFGDGVPVGLAGVELAGGAPVQGDGCDAVVAGDLARLEVGEVVLVDALAHLDGQRNVARARPRWWRP